MKCFKYFKKTIELENKTKFHRFIRDVCHSYMVGDGNVLNYLDENNEFHIPWKGYLRMSADTTPKKIGGQTTTFSEFAGNWIVRSVLLKDWYNFLDTLEDHSLQDNGSILYEMYHVKAILGAVDYLEPLIEYINRGFDEVQKKYDVFFQSVVNIPQIQEDEKIYLKWNGTEAQLLTLFKRLILNRNPVNNQCYIGNEFKEIRQFVKENFLNSKGKPFDKSSIDKYLSSKGRVAANEVEVIDVIRYIDKDKKTKEAI